MRRGSIAFLIAAAFLGAAIVAGLSEWQRTQKLTSSPTFTGVARVIDGDSLDVAGIKTRLLGIDAPELAQICTRDETPIPCGREAKSYITELLHQQSITCNTRGLDRYGRTLAVCSSPQTPDINAAMVLAGWAVSYYGAYETQEAEARLAGRGLWAYHFDIPKEWRRAHPRR